MNTWVLAKDLKGIRERTGEPAVREVAGVAEQNYLYPVDSQVISPQGELLGHVCANDLGADAVGQYLELLEKTTDE